MDSTDDRDPLFTRYKAAWTAYQALDANQVELGCAAVSTPYKHAAHGSGDGPLCRAALELASARAAYWCDPDHGPDAGGSDTTSPSALG
jgi:hypothetical protein